MGENEVTKFDANLIDEFSDQVDNDVFVKDEKIITLSTQSGIFGEGEHEYGESYVAAVIASAMTRRFYVGSFDDKENSRLLCAGAAFSSKNIKPFDDATEPQCGSCLTCKRNKFVKKSDGSWGPKQCSERLSMVLITSPNIDHAADDNSVEKFVDDLRNSGNELRKLSVPPTSTGDIVEFFNQLSVRYGKMPTFGFLVKFSMKREKKVNFRIVPELIGPITDTEMLRKFNEIKSTFAADSLLVSPFGFADNDNSADNDGSKEDIPF